MRRTSIWGIIIIVVWCIEILHASDRRATAESWRQLGQKQDLTTDHLRPMHSEATASHIHLLAITGLP